MNPLDIKHRIAGQPYRLARHIVGESIEDDPELLIAGIGAAYTAVANLAAPLSLIQAGARGNRYFTGLTVGYSKLGYPMPLFNYVTPGSVAEKFGAKLGGKVGARKIGARVAGRMIPGLGWGLLAYDVYDVAVNRSLWGFDL
ncbi:MAG: putative membrane protein [Circoviridae sp.]|nr:MAG: putative membrane protein [Circoviridae sp.]